MGAGERENARSAPVGTKVPVPRLHCQTDVRVGRTIMRAKDAWGSSTSVHDEVRSLSIEELEVERNHILLGLLELRNKRANMAARKAVAV